MIDKRPAIVSQRKRLGDIEVDLMLGKKHKSQILVCLDRASLKVKLRKLQSKKSIEVKNVLLQLYQKSKEWLNTITFDNDSTFMLHHEIATKLEIKVLFYSPLYFSRQGVSRE
ncbi:MAG: IS30 family transposase [Bacteroidetes bacterium]|nr:IS30 family transposase [Bacteroidota bacterium]